MIRAFVLGGDFHSRTAYGMYDYIQEAVRTGECYLEWEGVGEPDKPLLKDKYASGVFTLNPKPWTPSLL
jgi:DNA polymerase-1